MAEVGCILSFVTGVGVGSPKVEDVFKLSGVPTYTFVQPVEYAKLQVALRTPGRGAVIEGPSGIGKTTAVKRALEDLGLGDQITQLSARKRADLEYIHQITEMDGVGIVIIDDFHRLNNDIQRAIADHLKMLADEERTDSKLIVLGINKAGSSLIHFARDLSTRLDIIRFEVNPESKIHELVAKGEAALNVEISIREEIVLSANGSFFIAQMLCHETCLSNRVLERQDEQRDLVVSFEVIRERVMEALSTKFMDIAVRFASGTRLRKEGRAPYLHILKWLAEAEDWSINLEREVKTKTELRGSVSQVVEKGHLVSLLESSPDFKDVLHFAPSTRLLSVEDPQFVFFLRNILWNKFAERVGFINIAFESRYDFALSFAGADREYAQRIAELLGEHEFEVFYDKHEQHRILAENIEDYLAPIYSSEAGYVVCLLGPAFPTRIWTKFESEQFTAVSRRVAYANNTFESQAFRRSLPWGPIRSTFVSVSRPRWTIRRVLNGRSPGCSA